MWGRGPSLEAPSSSWNLRTNKRGIGNLHSDLTSTSRRILGWGPVTVAGVCKPVTPVSTKIAYTGAGIPTRKGT